jgi:acylphosphatase
MSATPIPSRTVHIRVEGRVQGVGYRAWVDMTARELGLTGWVRNRNDRSVEAVLCGPAETVSNMLARCEKGPPGARVDRIEMLSEDAGSYEGFEVKATV